MLFNNYDSFCEWYQARFGATPTYDQYLKHIDASPGRLVCKCCGGEEGFHKPSCDAR